MDMRRSTQAGGCCDDLKIPPVSSHQFVSIRAAVLQWEGARACASGPTSPHSHTLKCPAKVTLHCGWGRCLGVFTGTCSLRHLCCRAITAGRWLWAARSFKMSKKIPHRLSVSLCIVLPSLVSLYCLSKRNFWMKGTSFVVITTLISAGLWLHLSIY